MDPSHGGLFEFAIIHDASDTETNNVVVLTSHFDDDKTNAGFQLHNMIIDGFTGCGGECHMHRYLLKIWPFFHKIECQFFIQLPKRNRITITYISFVLEISVLCFHEYMKVRRDNQMFGEISIQYKLCSIGRSDKGMNIPTMREYIDMDARRTYEEHFVGVSEQCNGEEPVATRAYCGTDKSAVFVAHCQRTSVHMRKTSSFKVTVWLSNS